jgi:hypothetical protein
MSTAQVTIEAVEFCARPFVRRLYTTLVVALAVFLVTLVAFKQPFRGYLAEVRLAGPVAEGLDLEEAAVWVKKIDAKVAAVSNRPSATPGKAQLRITYIAMQPQSAAARVEELAERWLYQYLPDRLQTYRQSALAELRAAASAARQREDQARQQLEVLRQTQLAQFHSKSEPEPVNSARAVQPRPSTEESANRNTLIQKLADLRRDIAGLSSQRTEEHPRVRTLALEAATLEQQLGLLTGQSLPPLARLAAPQFVSHTMHRTSESRPTAEIAAKINMALAELTEAASDRQTAEFCLSERMQDLTTSATSVHWSKAAAVSINRLGGTPRCSTLTFAGFLAIVAGIITFRAGRFDAASCGLQSTTELASSLELPILADLAYLRGHKNLTGGRLFTPQRIQLIVRLGEIAVAIAVGACLLAIAFEPSLARQVLADPFGALSEVLGRYGI